ncbi:hypothetical protein [Actinokineospora sp.]|uniref:hypothetical protein n=1 Tax=Actinokineospora sp. TaxID=1872133 RepID=UPI0040379308
MALIAGSGTANAAPPIVVGSCAASIQGESGTPLSLSPTAVLDPVLRIVRAVPLLGPTLAGGVGNALSTMGNIPLGVIPEADTTISGGTISAAALPRIRSALAGIPLIGPVLGGVISGVQGALTSGCGIVVTVVNTVAAPIQEGAGAVADVVEQGSAALPIPGAVPNNPGAPGQPGTGPGGGAGSPGSGGGAVQTPPLPETNQNVIGGVPPSGLPLYDSSFNFGRSPMSDFYSALPFAKAGFFSPSPGVRYGGAVPGYTPQFGILGLDTSTDGVQSAGRVDALGPVGGNQIAVSVLLAVLALSGVTAALVRTWVLRRTTA